MLKIKDDVDLKEIGCTISDCELDQIWWYDELLFDKNTRIILSTQFDILNVYLVEKRLNNLYDLIKSGLVEKV